MKIAPILSGLLVLALLSRGAAAEPVDAYNVTWKSPSQNQHGSMPLGNGEVAANAWMTADGELHLYLSRTDAWDDYARLVKVGKVRVRLEPNPIRPGQPFRQELVLRDGAVEITIGDKPATKVRVWVDANNPAVHVTAEGKQPFQATACIDLWRTNRLETADVQTSDVLTHRKAQGGVQEPMILEPDVLLTDQPGCIGWYHHNVKSVGPELLAKIQGLTEFQQPDPLLHRTFGGLVAAERGERINDLTLRSPSAKAHQFTILVHTRHPATPAEWLDQTSVRLRLVRTQELAGLDSAHRQWWAQFWDRSWIRAETDRKAGASLPSIVPANRHPVQVGRDQANGNRFAGQLGRVSLFDQALTEPQIAALASSGHAATLGAHTGLLWSRLNPQPGPATNTLALRGGLTVEAWVNPGQLGAGGARLVDKITAGGSDGFLLDTHPGNSLRFICGETTLQVKDALPANQWTHVAAVADPAAGGCRLYVNGKLAADGAGATIIDAADYVSRMYHLQRFITACAGRGRYPIKFNGTLFTVPPGPTEKDPDYRRWGPGYWWQNTRLPYLSLCASGDFDLQQPLFTMYGRELLPLMKYRTRRYLNHGGAFYPECIMFWGAIFSETYGWTPFEERQDKLQSSGWHKWEWVCGPEVAWMMLDYYDHTLDRAFLDQTLLPFAREALGFFDQHYPTNAAGQLVFHPSQAVETWWHCTNAAPEVAGCIAVTDRLLALPPDVLPAADRTWLQGFRHRLPLVPTRVIDGQKTLAPAEFFADKRNVENPELYPVFPFRLFAFNRPNPDWAARALEHRWDRGNFGWRQDDIFMAHLGLTNQAREFVVGRARKHDPGQRFPAFWGPNYDWTPDQDHGGVLMKAFQAMLLQTDGDKIYLAPAWPKEWNVTFKLHAPQKTVLEGAIRNGKVEKLKVTPASRKKDVVVN